MAKELGRTGAGALLGWYTLKRDNQDMAMGIYLLRVGVPGSDDGQRGRGRWSFLPLPLTPELAAEFSMVSDAIETGFWATSWGAGQIKKGKTEKRTCQVALLIGECGGITSRGSLLLTRGSVGAGVEDSPAMLGPTALPCSAGGPSGSWKARAAVPKSPVLGEWGQGRRDKRGPGRRGLVENHLHCRWALFPARDSPAYREWWGSWAVRWREGWYGVLVRPPSGWYRSGVVPSGAQEPGPGGEQKPGNRDRIGIHSHNREKLAERLMVMRGEIRKEEPLGGLSQGKLQGARMEANLHLLPERVFSSGSSPPWFYGSQAVSASSRIGDYEDEREVRVLFQTSGVIGVLGTEGIYFSIGLEAPFWDNELGSLKGWLSAMRLEVVCKKGSLAIKACSGRSGFPQRSEARGVGCALSYASKIKVSGHVLVKCAGGPSAGLCELKGRGHHQVYPGLTEEVWSRVMTLSGLVAMMVSGAVVRALVKWKQTGWEDAALFSSGRYDARRGVWLLTAFACLTSGRGNDVASCSPDEGGGQCPLDAFKPGMTQPEGGSYFLDSIYPYFYDIMLLTLFAVIVFIAYKAALVFGWHQGYRFVLRRRAIRADRFERLLEEKSEECNQKAAEIAALHRHVEELRAHLINAQPELLAALHREEAKSRNLGRQVQLLEDSFFDKNQQLINLERHIRNLEDAIGGYERLRSSGHRVMTRAYNELEHHFNRYHRNGEIHVANRGAVWHWDGMCYKLQNATVRELWPCTTCANDVMTPHIRNEQGVTLENAITGWLVSAEFFDTSVADNHNQDLKDLQKYIIGKIDVCIEADADVRRDQQILNERMQLVADDLRLLMEEHQRLANRTLGVVEENEEMRVLLGQVREDNEHLRHENFQVSTRVLSLEGSASERWVGFAPGILYFRNWHRTAKGEDVQLSSDLSIAVGRGFLAATGVVIGNDEGLAIGDGPCRHFGTPGCFSSYYELEVDEITAAPAGSGGLYVGMSLQSGEEITKHPRKEFDGWLVGGNRKAMTVRASCGPDTTDDKLPDTFAPSADERDLRDARRALKLLRTALPPLAKGKAEEVELRDSWSSEVPRALCVHLAMAALAVCMSYSPLRAAPTVFNIPRRDLFQAALLVPTARAEEARVYSETDNLGEVWTTASVLKRRAKELEKLSQRKPQRSEPRWSLSIMIVPLLYLDCFEGRSGKLWELSAPTSATSTAEARRAQFAALAAAVDLGIIGAYGNDAEGLLSLAKALRGLCRDNMAAKRQVAFALSLLPPGLQPTEVDIPSSDLNEAAAATDAALRRLRSKSLADRLAQLIPEAWQRLSAVRSTWAYGGPNYITAESFGNLLIERNYATLVETTHWRAIRSQSLLYWKWTYTVVFGILPFLPYYQTRAELIGRLALRVKVEMVGRLSLPGASPRAARLAMRVNFVYDGNYNTLLKSWIEVNKLGLNWREE
eukprot:s3265_g1.t1